MNKKRFFQNALLLIVFTFLLRLVFTAFRVMVANKVGAECMGLYQLTFAIYGISVTFATSGINFAATRLVTQAIASGKFSFKSVMTRCIVYSLLFSSAAMLIILVYAEPIGIYLLCDERCILSLRAFAVSLPFISVSSAVSGYFYAIRNVSVTLVSRFIEQATQIISFFILLQLVPQGDLELSCLCIVLSGAISESFGGIFLIAYFFIKSKKEKARKNKGIWGKIFAVALPSALGAYLKSGLQTVENVLIPIGFRKYGASKSTALEGYGMLCSMVMPVIFFPSFVLSSFSMLLIPEFTEAQTREKSHEISKTADLSIKLTLMFSLFVAANFIVFGKPLGEVLYSSEKAGALIEIMAPIIPFMYLDSIADGMLKGLGEYNRVLAYSSIDTTVSIAMIYFIVPKTGLYGYIAVVYISTMLNAFLSIRRLLIVSGNRIKIFGDIVLPFVFAFVSANASKLIWNLLLHSDDTMSITICICTSIFILAFLIVLSKGNIYSTFRTAIGVILPQKSNFKRKKRIEIS